MEIDTSAGTPVNGYTRKVLDHGYVKLIDSMGTDISIIEAARMSTNKGFLRWDPGIVCGKCGSWKERVEDPLGSVIDAEMPKCDHIWEEVPGDEKLLTYLYKNKHATPFEMCELVIEIQAPILVFREWHRHRTQCLAGDTRVYFDLPGGVTRRGTQKYSMTMEELYRKWQLTLVRRSRPERQTDGHRISRRNRIRGALVRQMDKDGNIVHGHIKDVLCKGRQECVRMTLEYFGGFKSIVCTPNHKFCFENGWGALADKLDVKISEAGTVSWRDSGLKLAVNGFEVGNVPWNKGLTYKNPNFVVSDDHKAAISRARSGTKSNFYKHGKHSGELRTRINTWLSSVREEVYVKYDYACQLCGIRGDRLDLHHVDPVWHNEDLTFEKDNLRPLCRGCHMSVTNGNELGMAEVISKGVVKLDDSEQRKIPRSRWQTIERVRYLKVKSIEYVGWLETYDLVMEAPNHNFIAEGIVTHNSYNEMSARYIQMPNLHYIPEKVRMQSKKHKQGADDAGELSQYDAEGWRSNWEQEQDDVYGSYDVAVKEGIEKGLARLNTPVSRYSRMRAKANLRNWLAFLSLRHPPTALWEIRQFANVVAEIIKDLWPRTFWLWEEYTRYALSLSRTEVSDLVKLFGNIVTSIDMDERSKKVVSRILNTRQFKVL